MYMVRGSKFKSQTEFTSRRTAICRGAVFKGFVDGLRQGNIPADGLIDSPIMITSTVSRASFGVSLKRPFDEDEHIAEDKTWDTDEHVWMAHNQMSWYLKRVSSLPVIQHADWVS